jgi:hypothetical protein
VKCFARAHIEQARKARQQREADFAVLVTNAFPSKRQYYFVEKAVFVISPISLEPVTYTLRESLIRMAILKITNRAKERAVQKVYEYLSSSEYKGKINDMAGQLVELRQDLQSEIAAHKRTWEKRYGIYRDLFNDVAAIDYPSVTSQGLAALYSSVRSFGHFEPVPIRSAGIFGPLHHCTKFSLHASRS